MPALWLVNGVQNIIGFLPLEAPVTMKVLDDIVCSRNTEWTEKMHIRDEKKIGECPADICCVINMTHSSMSHDETSRSNPNYRFNSVVYLIYRCFLTV